MLGLRISLGGVCCLLSRLLSTRTKCIDGKNVNDGDGNTNNFFSSLNIPTSLLSDVVICQPPWALGASSGKHGVLDDDNDNDGNDGNDGDGNDGDGNDGDGNDDDDSGDSGDYNDVDNGDNGDNSTLLIILHILIHELMMTMMMMMMIMMAWICFVYSKCVHYDHILATCRLMMMMVVMMLMLYVYVSFYTLANNHVDIQLDSTHPLYKY